jgi:hypothetical protein
MSVQVIKQIKAALSNLNPDEVRRTAERPLSICLIAAGAAGYDAIEDFLTPPPMSREKRMQVVATLHRADDPQLPARFDLVLQEHLLPRQQGAFLFNPATPYRTVRDVLDAKNDLGLALARQFPVFREPVVSRVIGQISKENAMFSLATALPNVVPNLIELPWAIGEFASDTAFLTMNQFRMAFLIAAASDSEVGYREQKAQLMSILGGAFGWRALARELAGKIPLAGGLIPKAAIAYAGTYVVGRGLEKFHRAGYGLTREERREEWDAAFREGRGVAEKLLAGVKKVDLA